MLLFVVLSYVGSVTLHKRQFYWTQFYWPITTKKTEHEVPEALALMV